MSEDTCGPTGFFAGYKRYSVWYFFGFCASYSFWNFCLYCGTTVTFAFILYYPDFSPFYTLYFITVVITTFLLSIVRCYTYRHNFVLQQRKIKLIFTWTNFITIFYAYKASWFEVLGTDSYKFDSNTVSCVDMLLLKLLFTLLDCQKLTNLFGELVLYRCDWARSQKVIFMLLMVLECVPRNMLGFMYVVKKLE